jgi:DNA-directed RNA polymerase specialized sigma24 family protein
VSGERVDRRLQVETWEMELAKRIAGSFRPGDDDLAAELLKRLVELKAKKLEAIRDWQAFLVQSLYNAAKNIIRHEDVLRRHAGTLEFGGNPGEDRPSWLEERLVAPEDPIDLRMDLPRVWEALTPEMRELWRLLFEEEGNASAVAKRLGRPRKTVEYWIRKLKTFLNNSGID